jgi:hypothetical protein
MLPGSRIRARLRNGDRQGDGMAAEPGSQNLATEFDVLTARAGLTIPPDRRAELLTAFADLRAEIARLHAPLPPTLEPAAVYRPEPSGKAR